MVKFISPIGGEPYEDWTIVNYVDKDPTSGILDYRGGTYTYDGHDAIDFMLANFVAMEQGIPVYAAASGTVTCVHDGEFDRNTPENPVSLAHANFVTIDHGQEITTYYYHLKKNSISVAVGDTVSAGQQIGEVGSSGFSNEAHLHFAVYQNGQVIETFDDVDRWWQSPAPQYAGDVSGSLDHGISDHAPYIPDFAELRDRPEDHDIFRQVNGQEIFPWFHLHGIGVNDVFDLYSYKPNQSEYTHFTWNTGEIHYGWWVPQINLPNNPDLGEWTIEVQLNGTQLFQDSFTVISNDAPALSINDVSVFEDDQGQKNALFQVSRMGIATDSITVDYATANGTATGGEDYEVTTGTLTFDPNETEKTITVPVIGDTAVEPNEYFFVNLTSPNNAVLLDPRGTGDILDNNDVNQAPTDIFLTKIPAFGQLPVGTALGNFSSKDPNTGDTFTYSLVDGNGSTHNNLFQITCGQLQTNTPLNTEDEFNYSIRVRTTDRGGLFYEETVALSKDTINPTIIDVLDVTPDLRNSPVTEVKVELSEQINLTTFEFNDLTLTLDGNPITLNSTVTISPLLGTTSNYEIAGLETFTNADGTYQLTVNAKGIEDLAGNVGTNSDSDIWVMDTTDPIIIDVIDVTPNPSNAPVTDLKVHLSEEINLTTFDFNDLTLTLDANNIPLDGRVTITQLSETIYNINGLENFTTADGSYELTVSAIGIQDLAGNSGTGSNSDRWLMDTTGPTIIDVIDVTPNPGNTPITNVKVKLSEEINLTTFDFNDLTLTLDANNIPLDGTVTITQLSETIYHISGLNTFTEAEGSYELTLNATGIKDLAGNAGIGSNSDSWLMDTTAPIITVDRLETNDPTPQLTGTINDHTAIIQVTVGGNTYNATNNENGTWTLTDNLITPNLAKGTYDVQVIATDTAGNIGIDATTDELKITSGNYAPVAIDDTATANQTPSNPKIIVAAELLTNDSDPEDDPLTIIAVSANAVDGENNPVGTVSLNSEGNILYTSTNDDFTGAATFNYTLSDGELTDTATVTVKVGISQDFSHRLLVKATAGDDLLNVNVGNYLGTLVGGLAGDDAINTGNGRDSIFGGLGNDILHSDGGRDYLFGGPGNDILNGGPGRDWLWGGLGSDLFILTAGEGQDFVRDFSIAEGDRLGLSSGLTYGSNISVKFTNNINYIYHESTILAMVQEVTRSSIEDMVYFQ